MNSEGGSAGGGLGFGLLLLVTGAGTLLLAGRIELPGIPGNHDPGPRALPAVLAILLMAGGGVQCVRGWRVARSARAAPEAADGGGWGERMRVAGLAAGLVLLAGAIPWVGFTPAAALFVTGFLLASGVRGWKALAAALVLAAAVEVLFGLAFRVPLPVGRLWALF